MFARLLRLSYPSTALSTVFGKSRHVTDAIRWMYESLHSQAAEDVTTDVGLAHAVQFVDVQADEHSPVKNGYQNLDEAEFAVGIYMYLRTRQAQAADVSILTTTTEQADLIRDIVRQKCEWHQSFGKPAAVCTIEEHQGQSNKVVILSLVRTTTVVETLDARRMAAAISTANDRLYVLCRLDLYRQCPTMSRIIQAVGCKQTSLALRLAEGSLRQVDSYAQLYDEVGKSIRLGN